jgi:cytoskeletal protein RodZ
MTVFDSQQTPIELGAKLREDQHATIFAVSQQAGLAAKIYKTPPNVPHRQKLNWMRHNPPYSPQLSRPSFIAWPTGLLHNDQEQFIGYLAPHLADAVPLSFAIHPEHQAEYLPGFNEDPRMKYHAAANIAGVLRLLHQHNYVMGAVSDQRILVTPAGEIFFTDADLLQVQVPQAGQVIIYPSPPAPEPYLPRELQGKATKSTVWQPEHDCFGLAVLIFQLLTGGIHPYDLRWTGKDQAPSLAEAIRLGYFPYKTGNNEPIAPPPGAPELDSLPVADMFRNCFITGHHTPALRPRPEAWQAALAKAEKMLSPGPQAGQPTIRTRPIPAPVPGTTPRPPQTKPGLTSKKKSRSKTKTAAKSRRSQAAQRPPWVWAVTILVAGILCSGALLMIDELGRLPALPGFLQPVPAPENPEAQIAPEQRSSPDGSQAEQPSYPESSGAPAGFTPPTESSEPAGLPTDAQTINSSEASTNDDTEKNETVPASETEATPLPPAETDTPPATQTLPPTLTAPQPPTEPSQGVVTNIDAGQVFPFGQPIKLETTVSDPTGVSGAYVWISRNETNNRQLISNNYHACQNTVSCQIEDEFTNLAAGQYLIQLLVVKTGQAATQQAEIPITIQ